MLPIHYPTTYKALDSYIDLYNQKQLSSGKIKASVLLTAKEIIRIYGAFLIKEINKGKFQLEVDEIPPLRTNNVQLSKLTKSSPRTIQRHLKRLEKVGVIISKSFRGTNGGYDLLINPNILSIRGRKGVYNEKNSFNTTKNWEAENQLFKNSNTTKCPHTYPSNNRYFNNIIIDVDNSFSINQKNSRNERLTLFTGNVTGNAERKTGEEINKAERKAGEWVNEASQIVDSARSASLKAYASALWKLAQNTLYANTPLTDHQKQIGEQLLYKWYEPVDEKYLQNIHIQYCQRIEIVRKYVEKSPDTRFVPFPYQFFDPENKNGFTATKAWYKKHRSRKWEIRKKLIFLSQVRKVKQCLKSKNAQSSMLEIYRSSEKRIKALKDDKLLNEFYKQLIPKNTNTY